MNYLKKIKEFISKPKTILPQEQSFSKASITSAHKTKKTGNKVDNNYKKNNDNKPLW